MLQERLVMHDTPNDNPRGCWALIQGSHGRNIVLDQQRVAEKKASVPVADVREPVGGTRDATQARRGKGPR